MPIEAKKGDSFFLPKFSIRLCTSSFSGRDRIGSLISILSLPLNDDVHSHIENFGKKKTVSFFCFNRHSYLHSEIQQSTKNK